MRDIHKRTQWARINSGIRSARRRTTRFLPKCTPDGIDLNLCAKHDKITQIASARVYKYAICVSLSCGALHNHILCMWYVRPTYTRVNVCDMWYGECEWGGERWRPPTLKLYSHLHMLLRCVIVLISVTSLILNAAAAKTWCCCCDREILSQFEVL